MHIDTHVKRHPHPHTQCAYTRLTHAHTETHADIHKQFPDPPPGSGGSYDSVKHTLEVQGDHTVQHRGSVRLLVCG